jgi:pantoate--beta-alanine ligase
MRLGQRSIGGVSGVQTVNRLDPLRNSIAELRNDGPVALVPTMGALHQGHLELVREARARAAHVVVSIFVNPRQFGAGEDLGTYPRQPALDGALLEQAGVSLLWIPSVQEMYPAGYATHVTVDGVSEPLCGRVRPGHFGGVATVVCKLFNQVRPDFALFGEKDWQQLAVIRRMARDLDLSLPSAGAIIGVPTVREADGLALSSRNAYLSPEQREQASILPAAMRGAVAAIKAGEDYGSALAILRDQLLGGGFQSIDYAEVRDADSLALLSSADTGSPRLFVAARIGGTRLIDNLAVG